MAVVGGTESAYIRAPISGKKIVEALKAGKDVALFDVQDPDNMIYYIFRVENVEVEDIDGVSYYTCTFRGNYSIVMFGYDDLDLVNSDIVARKMAVEAGLISQDDLEQQ